MCRSPTSSCSGPAGPRSVSGHAPSPARLSAGDTRSGSGPSRDAGVSRVASGACTDCQIPSYSYRPFAGGLPHARRLSTVSRRVCSQTALCARLPHVDTDLRCGWGGLVQRIPVVSRKAACNRATTVPVAGWQFWLCSRRPPLFSKYSALPPSVSCWVRFIRHWNGLVWTLISCCHILSTCSYVKRRQVSNTPMTDSVAVTGHARVYKLLRHNNHLVAPAHSICFDPSVPAQLTVWSTGLVAMRAHSNGVNMARRSARSMPRSNHGAY